MVTYNRERDRQFSFFFPTEDAGIPREASILLVCAKTHKSERDRMFSISFTLVSFCASKLAKCLLYEVCPHLNMLPWQPTCMQRYERTLSRFHECVSRHLYGLGHMIPITSGRNKYAQFLSREQASAALCNENCRLPYLWWREAGLSNVSFLRASVCKPVLRYLDFLSFCFLYFRRLCIVLFRVIHVSTHKIFDAKLVRNNQTF